MIYPDTCPIVMWTSILMHETSRQDLNYSKNESNIILLYYGGFLKYPKIGLPPKIICFCLVFCITNHPFWLPPFMETFHVAFGFRIFPRTYVAVVLGLPGSAGSRGLV